MRAGRDDAGFAGGLDGLVFGVLLFVFGSLAVVNAWQVVDAKFAMASAAREGARAFVESSGSVDEAESAAVEAVVGHGRVPRRLSLSVDGAAARCARVVVEARYRVPFVVVPVVGSFGNGLVVSARHSEVVDPYRSGLPGAASC